MANAFALLAVFAGCLAVVKTDEVCCGVLGCFKDGGDFFDLTKRPIQTLPSCDLVAKLKLHLNTRKNPTVTQILDPLNYATVTGSDFAMDKDTVVLVHGFTDIYDWPWWTDTKTALLAERDINVIRVEWSAGNLPPLIQAAANARLVASFAAKLFTELKQKANYDPLRVHLVGHSLGAQLVGYIGAQVKQIGRITGLDPAGMYFTDMPISVRLDPTDAKVVDTMATDMGSVFHAAFGTNQPMGHLNFYVNGGSDQPGCSGKGNNFDMSSYSDGAKVAMAGYNAVMCDHYRALALFQETISSQKCAYQSYVCNDYGQYQNGNCFTCDGPNKCSKLGLHMDTSLAVPNVQKKLYTTTGDRRSNNNCPFYAELYKVSINIKSNSGDKDEKGNVFLTLEGAKKNSEKFRLNEDTVDLNPGNQRSFLIRTSEDTGDIKAVTFEWDFKSYNPLDLLRKHYITLQDGQVHVTDADGKVLNFKLPQDRLEEDKAVRGQLGNRAAAVAKIAGAVSGGIAASIANTANIAKIAAAGAQAA